MGKYCESHSLILSRGGTPAKSKARTLLETSLLFVGFCAFVRCLLLLLHSGLKVYLTHFKHVLPNMVQQGLKILCSVWSYEVDQTLITNWSWYKWPSRFNDPRLVGREIGEVFLIGGDPSFVVCTMLWCLAGSLPEPPPAGNRVDRIIKWAWDNGEGALLAATFVNWSLSPPTSSSVARPHLEPATQRRLSGRE